MNNKVREKRMEKKMTQDELSAKSGVSRQTIISIESGAPVNTTIKTLKCLATALGTTVDALL